MQREHRPVDRPNTVRVIHVFSCSLKLPQSFDVHHRVRVKHGVSVT